MYNLVSLYVCKNTVFLQKQGDYREFTSTFLVKYEDVKKVDIYRSSKKSKKFVTVKERRELYLEDENFIKFPRGLLSLIPESEYVAEYHDGDESIITPLVSPELIRTSLLTFDLRDDQVVAVNKCIRARRGVIQLPTATGKSAIIASTIKLLLETNPSTKILVLAPTLSTVSGINNTLIDNKIDTHIFAHPDREFNHSVTTSLVQSLIDEDPDKLSQIGAVFYDECLPGSSQILLPDGSYKSIEDIYNDSSVGCVLSYNLSTNQYETKNILHKYKTEFNDRFCRVYYKDPVDGYMKGISCTENHKIWTRDRGYVPAGELTTDDYIKIDFPFARFIPQGLTYMKVDKVVLQVGKLAKYKYNLEVEDNHNYFADSVLVSNCHHLKCGTWNKLNLLLKNVEYSLGFSALSIDKSEISQTDIRNVSYQSALIMGSSGRVIMHMDPSYYIKKGIIALPALFRVNNEVVLPKEVDPSNWSKVSKLGLMSTPRTDKVAELSRVFSKYGRKILILVSERNYAFTLGRFLVEKGVTNFGISFGSGTGYMFSSLDPEGTPQYKDENTLDVINKLSTGEINVLIGTSHIDEGVDIKSLDVCILACGGKSDRRLIQRVGRVLRKSKSGKYAYIVDFTDTGNPVLTRQSNIRMNLYKDSIGIPDSLIYDKINTESVENVFREIEGLNSEF